MIQDIQVQAAGIAGRLPRTYQEAISGIHGEEWLAGCRREVEMLTKLNVWEEVELPTGQRAVFEQVGVCGENQHGW